MIIDPDYGLLPDEREDHFPGLKRAQLVGTDTLLTPRDNIGDRQPVVCRYSSVQC